MLRRLNGSFGRLGKFMWVMGGAAALLLALLLVASSSGHTHALGRVATVPAAASTVEVGTGLPGLNLYEFVGRVDQAGVAFTGYGYLSYLRGMDNSQIFSNPLNPSEGTAHFTYYATATLTSPRSSAASSPLTRSVRSRSTISRPHRPLSTILLRLLRAHPSLQVLFGIKAF